MGGPTTTTATDNTTAKPVLNIELVAQQQSHGASVAANDFLMMASYTADDEPESADADADDSARAPLDLVAVIDVSGSMAGSKLNMVKQTLEFVTEQLQATDRLAIVAFDSNVTVPLQLTTMDKNGTKLAVAAAQALHAGSCTNLSGGLVKGLQLVAESRPTTTTTTTAKTDSATAVASDRVTSVLLLTDGHANEGVTTMPALRQIVSRSVEKMGFPVSLFSFGFGSNHNDAMLRELATAANGMYYFIESNDDVPFAFADCLGGLLSVVAQNVVLTLEFPGADDCGASLVKLLSTVPRQAAKGPNTVELQLGDVYAGEDRDIVMQLRLPKLDTACDNWHLCQCTLEYFDLAACEVVTTSLTLQINRPAEHDASAPADPRLETQMQRLRTQRALEEARGLDKQKAQERLRAAREELSSRQANNQNIDSEFTSAMVSELDEACEALDNDYGAAQMIMQTKSMAHGRQRAAVSKASAYAPIDDQFAGFTFNNASAPAGGPPPMPSAAPSSISKPSVYANKSKMRMGGKSKSKFSSNA